MHCRYNEMEWEKGRKSARVCVCVCFNRAEILPGVGLLCQADLL